MEDSTWLASSVKWVGLALVSALGGGLSYLAYLRKTKNPFVLSDLLIDCAVGAFSGCIAVLMVSETDLPAAIIIAICGVVGTFRTGGLLFVQSILAKRLGVDVPDSSDSPKN